MQSFGTDEITALFARFAEVFAEQRDALIALDGKVGDSDLGLTMAKGFKAAAEAVNAMEAATPGVQFKTAGAAIARAAPSTMGTLMATGFLRGSAAVSEKQALGTSEIAAFWAAFRDGVAHRGRAQVGDKTVLDVLHPIAETMQAQAQDGAPLADALTAARAAADEALEGTKALVAQHGKAAAYQEKTCGIQDAGATVAVLLIGTMAEAATD